MKCIIIPVTPFQQNCSVIWDESTRQAAVVDPGGDLDRIQTVLDRERLSLVKILVTHGHLDHAAGTAALAARLGVPIEGPHRDDQFLIDELPEQARKYGFPTTESFTPGRWLAQGDEVSVGGETFEVRHCPGHTPGHVVFVHAKQRIAFVGDVLFAGSIGRTDFPRGDHAALLRSIRENLFPIGDDLTFVPGHGPTSTFGQERRSNPFVGDRAIADRGA